MVEEIIRSKVQISGRYIEACKQKESFLRQKSRVQWHKLGDQNSKFFSRFITGRINKKKIVQIQSFDGGMVCGEVEVASVIVNYFEDLFGSSSGHVVEPLDARSWKWKTLSELCKEHLSRRISKDEIKKSVPFLKCG